MAETRRTEDPVSIAYDIEGSGPLVVFLHGIGGNRLNWTDQLAHFGRRFCTAAWDARGYLDSDDSPQTLRFSDFADDLCRLLDRLKAEQAHLVGLSMGGMIIQDFYGRYADRVATLALVDTSSGFGGVPEAVRQDFLARRLNPLENGLSPADIAPEVVKVLVAESAGPAVRERLIASMSALRTEAYKQALHAYCDNRFPCGPAADYGADPGGCRGRGSSHPALGFGIPGETDSRRYAGDHPGLRASVESRKA